MRIEWLTICQAVRVREDGLTDIIGAGLSGMAMPQFPVRTLIPVAACIAVDPGEDIAVDAATLIVFDPDNNPCGGMRSEGIVTFAGGGALGGGKTIRGFAPKFGAPTPGIYTITLSLGAAIESAVSFELVPLPSTPK